MMMLHLSTKLRNMCKIGSESMVELQIDSQKIIDVLKLLIKEKKFDWLHLPSEKTTSPSSYLFYMQNK